MNDVGNFSIQVRKLQARICVRILAVLRIGKNVFFELMDIAVY